HTSRERGPFARAVDEECGQPSDETAATDAGSYWSFESEETTWIDADAVEEQQATESAAPAGDEVEPSAEAPTVSAAPDAGEAAEVATAAADPDELNSAGE